MDPHPTIPMDLPPPITTTFTFTNTPTDTVTEQTTNHTAQVANPTSYQAPSPNHPPYAEMITSAVAALKERNGSSKTAIAKFIDRVYTNLPSTHSALLTHHLKRLKTSGQLVMEKHSYKLPPPRSAPLPFPPLDNGDDLPPADVLSAQPKKRPGRPPKAKPNPVPPAQTQIHNDVPLYPAQQQSFVPLNGPAQHCNTTDGPTEMLYNVAVGPAPVLPKRKPGRPAKPKLGGVTPAAQYGFPPPAAALYGVAPPAAPYGVAPPPPAQYGIPPPSPVDQSNGAVNGSDTVLVADETPAKRRPGRPPRAGSTGPQPPRPKPMQPTRSKRRPGRPAKYGPVPVPVRNGGGVAAIQPRSVSSGKPRGRPRRNVPPVAATNGPVSMQPKKRGRKPSVAAPANPANPAMFVPHVGVSATVPGAVMVPYAPVPSSAPVAANGVPAPAAAKRRGRPPMVHGMQKKPRNITGKLGRPKKNGVAKPDSSSSQHLAAYLEIKGKLEFLQTKIKQTIGVLRPCITTGLSPHAVDALEQLEELVTEVANVQGQQSSVEVNVQEQQDVVQQV